MAIFSGNNIDLKVRVGGSGSITVSLIFDNVTVSEVYNAIDGEITIIDFKSLANSFFNFYKTTLLDNLPNCNVRQSSTTMDFQVKNGGTSLYHNDVVFSQIPVDIEFSNFKKFVNRFPETSALPVGGMACINWYKGYKLVQKAYYWREGQIKEVEFIPTWSDVRGGNMATLPFTWENTLEWAIETEDCDVKMEDIKLVTFDLYENDELIDSISLTPSYHRVTNNIAFIGALGEAEVLSFRGNVVIADELDPSFLDINHEYRKVRTDLVKAYKVNTGYLRPFEIELFHDMLESPYVCLIAADGSAIPITITECEAEETLPHVKPTAFKFAYRVADNNAQRVFSRQPVVPNKRVFTTEYTKVFA